MNARLCAHCMPELVVRAVWHGAGHVLDGLKGAASLHADFSSTRSAGQRCSEGTFVDRGARGGVIGCMLLVPEGCA
jgi:hypothetical protein